MNAIKTLFSLTFKLIKWTLIIGVIGFVALFIVGLFMTNKEAFNGITITEDHIAMVVGSSVILLGLVVVCKIGNAASESGAIGSLFNVIFLPITLPFKVLGAIASMGSGSSRSYSGPSTSSPKRHAWYVTMKAHSKSDKYFCRGIITSDGYLKTQRYMATDKKDAIIQATNEHAELLLTGRGRITKTQINYLG
jgi:hypothetical protein